MTFTSSLADHVTYICQKGKEKRKPRIQLYSNMTASYIALTFREAISFNKENIDKWFMLMYRKQARNSGVASPMR